MSPESHPESPVQSILFCTDFSPNADFAFHIALDIVRRRAGAVLYILHVLPESEAQFWKTYIYELDDVDNKARHDIDVKVRASYLDHVPPGLDVRVEYRVGRDHHEILAFAHEKDTDLIVIGRQGRSSLGKALFGNVTEIVARKADCPVLIIPLSFEQKTRHLMR